MAFLKTYVSAGTVIAVGVATSGALTEVMRLSQDLKTPAVTIH